MCSRRWTWVRLYIDYVVIGHVMHACMNLGYQHLALAWQGYNIVLDHCMQRRGNQALERNLLESEEHFAAIPGGQSQYIRAALNRSWAPMHAYLAT